LPQTGGGAVLRDQFGPAKALRHLLQPCLLSLACCGAPAFGWRCVGLWTNILHDRPILTPWRPAPPRPWPSC